MNGLTGNSVGEYVVVGQIGRGGMGIVYEGRHPLIGKRVAVKVLLPEASAQQELVDRFLAEARAVNAIRHRGIVDIFGFGTLANGAHYFVMELLEGMPMDEIIRTRAPVAVSDAMRWTDEILEALDAAHNAGVIHRDIKPSNLFLVDTGRGVPYIKLLDFGIAKLSPFRGTSTPQTSRTSVVGTPDYMAPEQARGKNISGATDLYAVGCVLFELLAARRLFPLNTALEVMFAHVERKPEKLSRINPAVPASLDAFVLGLLAKSPDDRPKSAREAREQLHLIFEELGEQPSLQAPTNRSPRIVSGARPVAATHVVLEPTLPSVSTPERTDLATPISGRRWPLIAAATALPIVAAAAVLFFQQPTANVELVPPPPITAVADAGAAEQPVIDAGAPVAIGVAAAEPEAGADAGAPVVVKPVRPAGPTLEQLSVRYRRLNTSLLAKDKRAGEPDRILHKLLDAIGVALGSGPSLQQRKELSAQLDDVATQLKQQ